MENIFYKVRIFIKTNKKKIIKVALSALVIIIILTGGLGAYKYSHAQSNIKYSQDQLQKVALGKVQGEVVDVEKKLNFKRGIFEYDFKIKDKDNILNVV